MGQKFRFKHQLKKFGGINVKIAIVAAMAEELAPFREVFPSEILWEKGKTKIEAVNQELFLVESGIGKANAAAALLVISSVNRFVMINKTASNTCGL